MKKHYRILLSVLSGLLLSAGWPSYGIPFLLFTAFVPLLVAEQKIYADKGTKKEVFLNAYIAFFVWNTITTWWVCNATIFGGCFAIVFNSLFMAIVFLLFHITKKNAGKAIGYISLPVYWIAFEYLHLNWELSWSWLNLGNGFAAEPSVIQWYEYTGTLGGTLWILAVNIMILITYFNLRATIESVQLTKPFIIQNKKPSNKHTIYITLALIIIPCWISFFFQIKRADKCEVIECVAVQPNIDPYNEKFGGLSLDKQLAKMLALAEEKVTPLTTLVVFPETAISDGIWENKLEEEGAIQTIRSFIARHPQIKVLIGMSSFKYYATEKEKSVSARKFLHENAWYDAYNTAILMDTSKLIQLYHKSKLVPGVERMPYPGLFKFLDKYSINMGGMSGSLGMQNNRTALITIYKSHYTNFTEISKLSSPNSQLSIAPSICYESVYGEFMSKYEQNGANLICIITNDGWWGDTQGYKQHFQYASLRAIETRRDIVRSANTGISGFIDQTGGVVESTSWWKPIAIRSYVHLNKNITFYVKYGDYLGKISLIVSGIILLISGYLKLKKH